MSSWPAPSSTAAHPSHGRRRTALVATLGALTAVAPLATDMYVPSLPAMSVELHTDDATIQLTITAVLLGMVAGQLVLGPLSDRHGRRGLLLGGIVGFAVFSAACMVAPNIQVLILARFLEGAGGAAGLVLARAVIADRYRGDDVPRYFALLSQILSVAPVVAPLIGAAVISFSGWRGVFLVLAFIGLLLATATWALVPESLPLMERHHDRLLGAFAVMRHLVADRAFLGVTLILGFGSMALFAYVSGSAFVFEQLHGLSEVTYALVFAANAIAMLAGGWAAGRLARRYRATVLLTCAVIIAASGATGQLVAALFAGDSLVGSWIALFVISAGLGMLIPAAMSAGHAIGHRTSGASSAVLGGTQFLFGAAAAPLLALIPGSGSVPMSALMFASLALALLARFLLRARGAAFALSRTL